MPSKAGGTKPAAVSMPLTPSAVMWMPRHQGVEDGAAEAGAGVLHRLAGARDQVLVGPLAPARLFRLPPRLEGVVGRHARARRGAHLPGVVVGVGDIVEGVADAGARRVQPVAGDVLQRLHGIRHGLGRRGHLHAGAGRAAVGAPQRFGQLAVQLAGDRGMLHAGRVQLVAEHRLPARGEALPLALDVVAAADVGAVEEVAQRLHRALEAAVRLDVPHHALADRGVAQRIGGVELGGVAQPGRGLVGGLHERVGLAGGPQSLGAVGDLLQDVLRPVLVHAAALGDLADAVGEGVHVQAHLRSPPLSGRRRPAHIPRPTGRPLRPWRGSRRSRRAPPRSAPRRLHRTAAATSPARRPRPSSGPAGQRQARHHWPPVQRRRIAVAAAASSPGAFAP